MSEEASPEDVIVSVLQSDPWGKRTWEQTAREIIDRLREAGVSV